MPSWPARWNYEIVVSPHVIERMKERGFTEIDLRTMLADATGHRASVMHGRFIIETQHDGQPWESSSSLMMSISCWWRSQPTE